MKNLLLAIFAMSISLFAVETAYTLESGQKAILITGASSGIGRNLAETLAAQGHFVYAGARKQADMAVLNAIDNIMAVRLDVTRQDEIDAAVEIIKREGRGLYGLVNNAGVSVGGPLVELSDADMQFQMDVNMFGPFRVTRAFAPLIIASKGRISTTGSVAGIYSGGFFGGPYSMSKYAVEAFTDSLRVEMERFDVKVSVVEPGNYNSEISGTRLARSAATGQTGEDSLYKDDIEEMLAGPADRSRFKDPDEVSAAFVHALFDDKPKYRYLVVPSQNAAEGPIRHIIWRLSQLNADQEYSFTRDELIAFIDEELSDPDTHYE